MSIVDNIYYSGENGSARKFAKEMISSGTVDAIRNEAGNIRYDYFFPLDDEETVSNYLDVFRRLFILDNQMPFSPQMKSKLRIKQAEKRHFSDVSLAASLLKATPDSLINDLETLGFLFESLVEHDLRIYAQAIDANLYHYQDYNNNEIDAIIELKDGSYGAFEIKLGSNQIDKAAKNLIKVKNSIINNDGKGPKILCVIVGLGNFAYQREDGVYVIPINALKD